MCVHNEEWLAFEEEEWEKRQKVCPPWVDKMWWCWRLLISGEARQKVRLGEKGIISFYIVDERTCL